MFGLDMPEHFLLHTDCRTLPVPGLQGLYLGLVGE